MAEKPPILPRLVYTLNINLSRKLVNSMPTQEEKLNKLKQILEMMDENISKEDFVKSFENVVQLVLKIEKELNENNKKTTDKLIEAFSGLKGNLESKTNSELSGAISDLKQIADKTFREQEAAMNLIKDKVGKIKEGKDGKDGKDGVGIPGKDGKDGSPDTPQEIRDKLETLKGKERLSKEAIDGLVEALEELKKIREERRLFGGGGFSKMAMDLRIVDPYIPTGTINGVNTDFTLIKTPNPSGSLKVYRGGALQSLTEDYTLSGVTITFLVAPVVGEIIKVEHRI